MEDAMATEGHAMILGGNHGLVGKDADDYRGTPVVDALRSIVSPRSPEPLPESTRVERQAERRVVNVKVSSVWIPRPSRPRTEVDESSIDALAKSIKAIGLIEPIVVVEEVEEKCTDCQKLGNASCGPNHKRRALRLVAGERRLLAHVRADIADIEAAVYSSMPSERREDVAWHENVERVQLTIWDFYREVCARRVRNPGESIARLAERTDLTEGFLQDCETISEHVSPDLIVILRHDSRSAVFRQLTMAARLDGTTERERHDAQKRWWEAEGWRTRPPPKKKGGGGKRGPRARMATRDVEKIARRIEDDHVIQVGAERAELGAKQARIVAALLRATVAPPGQKAVGS